MTKARDIADLGAVTSRLDTVGASDGALSNRNLIINGAMQVWQRGTSSVTIGSGDFLADRFQMWDGTAGATTAEQSSEAPDGFGYSLKLAVTTADVALASNAYLQLGYYPEAQDLQRLQYGTAEAKTITVSFYVRSSKTGTYNVSFTKPDNTRNTFNKEYTIDSANTWERKSITIVPDANIKASGGAIDNDNGTGALLYWNLVMGSTYTVGTDNTWSTNNNAYSTTSVDNWMDSTSNDFYITGVQLEVGDTATPFEHRSYGDELARCQRYYSKSFPQGTAPVHDSVDLIYQQCRPFSSISFAGIGTQFPVEMRASPTMTIWTANASANTSSGRVSYYDGAWKNTTVNIHAGTSSNGFYFDGNATTGVVLIQYNFEADAEL